MNRDEMEYLTRAIKSHYPKFKLEKEIYSEWSKRLTNYEFKDIQTNFENYVLAGNKETITLIDLIEGLKTIKQKKPTKRYFFCMMCNKCYQSSEEADKCYEKDMDIRYINRMSKKFNINKYQYFKNLENMSLNEINKNYDSFILRVIEEQKKEQKLNQDELKGLRAYYKNVILKGGLNG